MVFERVGVSCSDLLALENGIVDLGGAIERY